MGFIVIKIHSINNMEEEKIGIIYLSNSHE